MLVSKKIVIKIFICLLIICSHPVFSASKLKQDPTIGFKLAEFDIFTLAGEKTKLANLWKEKPVLLITGSLSCPFTRASLKPSHKLIEKFSNVFHIALLYVIDAHPKGDVSPYRGEEWLPRENFEDNILIPQPKNQSERTDRANELSRLLNLKIPLLIDNMDNQNWGALGHFPNAGILINTSGEVIYKQKKFKARLMAKKMRTYLKTGKIETKKRRRQDKR